MKVKDLIIRGMLLFSERKAITTLWQELAENFYPQRADFTINRYIGEEFAEHLYSSYPIIVHRDLSTSFAAMLRPRSKPWFEISVDEDLKIGHESKQWLQWASKVQRKAMYDRKALFIRATTEGDADFALTGQCCISREINYDTRTPHLLYRCWHLRDVCWSEKQDGAIGEIYVKWKPTIKQLKEKKGYKLHHNIEKRTLADNLSKVDCMRLIVSTDIYEGQSGQGKGYPWMVVFIDVQNQHIMNEYAVMSHGFTLPRWQTVSGSQYAYSPAAVAGLPDARLLQAMSLTLLEAGEMSVRPPMIATTEAVRGDVQVFSGGITWADHDYDERRGEVLRPLTQDRAGLPRGYEVRDHQMAMLAEAFYINKLTLPPSENVGDMTAYETGQRVEEYVRAALPLFEPMEHDYNGQICEDTFDGLLRAGAFGAPSDMPREIQGKDIHFKFVSPLHDMIEREEAATFLESGDLIERALAFEPSAGVVYNTTAALATVLEGIGVEARHLRTDDEIQSILAENAEMARQEEAVELAKGGAQAARDGAQAEAVMAA